MALWRKSSEWAEDLRVGDIVELSGLQVRTFKSRPFANTTITSTLAIGHRHFTNVPFSRMMGPQNTHHLSDELVRRLLLWAGSNNLLPLSKLWTQGTQNIFFSFFSFFVWMHLLNPLYVLLENQSLAPITLKSLSPTELRHNAIVSFSAWILSVQTISDVKYGMHEAARTVVHLVDANQNRVQLIL